MSPLNTFIRSYSFASMDSTLLSLQAAGKVAEEMAKLDFHSRPVPSYHVREATPKDMKWIEEQKYAMCDIIFRIDFVEERNATFLRSWKR